MPMTASTGKSTWKIVTTAGSTLVIVALAIEFKATGIKRAATSKPTDMAITLFKSSIIHLPALKVLIIDYIMNIYNL